MAGFFGLFNYSKEGPGVAKNGPRKRPYVVFLEIFGRKIWKVTLAGLMWAVTNLLIFTRGLADAGLTFITRNYSREKHAFLREDFIESIKKNWRTALPIGIINTVVTGVLFFNIFYYATGMMPGLVGSDAAPMTLSTWDYVILAVTATGYVTFTWMKYYIPFLMITFKLSIKQIYRNAFLFAGANMPTNLLISVILIAVYGLLGGIVIAFAATKLNYLILTIVLALLVSVVPGFRSLLIQFCIFPSIKKLIIDPYYAANPGADKQARRDLNLDVEEDEPAVEGDVPMEEAVFVDTLPQPEEPKEKKAKRTLPRQYNEKEMRHFNRQVSSRGATDDDDDTI